jgi:hypothetical protein
VQRRAAARVFGCIGVGAAGCGGRVEYRIEPGWPVDRLAQLTRGHHPGRTDPLAVGGAHIELPGGRPRPLHAVAELHDNAAVLAPLCLVHPIARADREQIGPLVPAQIVDPDLQSRLSAQPAGGADIGQRRLLERKTLIGDR